MTGTREQEIQNHNSAAPVKAREGAKPDSHPCGGCSACHQMTGIQASGKIMAWSGEGAEGATLQRPCATNFFQRNLGNSYMQSLADRNPASGNKTTGRGAPVIQRKCNCGGSCESCAGKGEETGKIQAKLAVGSPDDEYEQEADRVADQVMRMSDSSLKVGVEQPNVGIGIRRLYTDSGVDIESAPDIELNTSGGQPLSPATRQFMEPRFGADFGNVQLHTGQDAHETATRIQARAFTYGHNIWLGSAESEHDRALMAHELTHVIQQGGADCTIVPDTESENGDYGLLKREMSSANGTVGNVSQPVKPKLSSGLMLQRADCPCCADSISIGNISRIDSSTRMGHSFDVSMALSYPASGPSGRCTLEWWEKTNVPYTAGMSPNTWTNMFALIPNSPTLAPWINRSERCGSSSPVTITDPPSLGRRPGRTVTRTLEFRLVINSMPPTSEGGCAAASQQVTAKQELSMVNGAPDWAASSFTTP